MYISLNRNIEYFGDIYDKRTNEYDDCEGVGEVIKKIRNNDSSWQSDDIVKQVPCVPIYKWDGKFYKDEASAKAGLTGSTAEEIITHTDTGRKELLYSPVENYYLKEKYPGSSTRKTNNDK